MSEPAIKLLKSISDIDREFFPNRQRKEGEKKPREAPTEFGQRLAIELLQNVEKRLGRG